MKLHIIINITETTKNKGSESAGGDRRSLGAAGHGKNQCVRFNSYCSLLRL